MDTGMYSEEVTQDEIDKKPNLTLTGQDSVKDHEGIFELIRRVASQPLLCNYVDNDRDQESQGSVKNAWKQVADGLIFESKIATEESCQRKWKNLRDYYVKKKRIERRDPRRKKIKWVYFAAMDAILKNTWNINERIIRKNSTVDKIENVKLKQEVDDSLEDRGDLGYQHQPLKQKKRVKRPPNKEILHLIRRVQSKPLLYDASVKEYNNNNLLKQAWKSVANGLILNNRVATVQRCQKKWKSLRDYYVRLKQSGKKKWVYLPAMETVLGKIYEENEGEIPGNMDLDYSEIYEDAHTEEAPLSPSPPEAVAAKEIKVRPFIESASKCHGIGVGSRSMIWRQKSKLRLKRRLLHQKRFQHVPLKSSPSLSSAAAPDKFSRCLLCLNQACQVDIESDIISANVRAIFILKRLLGVSSSELTSLFTNSIGEHPCKWITICGNCSPLIDSAKLINEQIISLEKTLDGFKRKCLERVKKSCEGNVGCIVCMETVCMCRKNLEMTKRIRNSVLRRNCSSPDDANTKASLVSKDQPNREDLIVKSEPVEPDHEHSVGDDDMNFNEEFSSMHLPEVESSFDAEYDDFVSITEEAQEGPQRNRARAIKSSKSKLSASKPMSSDAESENQLEDDIIHERGTSPMPMYQCSFCHHLPPMELDFYIVHILFHFRHPYRCRECSMYLSNAPILIDRHFKEYHSDLLAIKEEKIETVPYKPGRIWHCKECDSIFSTISERDTHEKDIHNLALVKEKSCNFCAVQFWSIDEVRLHKAVEHPEAAELCCTYCDASFGATSREGPQFRHGRELLDHRAARHSQQSILEACHLCGEVFSRARYLQEHLTSKHTVHLTRQATCHICYKEMRPNELKRHIYETHAPLPICEVCGKPCSGRLLKHHMYKEHGIVMPGVKLQVHKCPHQNCEYETTRLGCLTIHKRRHTYNGRKEHFCQYCGKAFKKYCYVQRHEKIHTNAETKPYACDVCGARFPVRNYLYTHKRVTHLKTWNYKSKKKVRKMI